VPWAAAAVYGTFALGLLLVLRALGLAGPRAPPREVLDEAERRVRWKLRAWLAFDFLVVLPAAAVVLALAVADDGARGDLGRVGLGLLAFLAPAFALHQQLRAHERRRAEARGELVAKGEREPAPRSDRGWRGARRRVR
jgi:hypothetical protein